jgi:HSP20 family protein
MSSLTFRNNNTVGFGPSFGRFFEGTVFDDLWAASSYTGLPVQNKYGPSVNETEEQYEISMAAPGLEKSDFNIVVENNKINISYDVSSKQSQHTYSSQYSKSYTLAPNCDADKISATYKSGVLTVAIPKTEASKAKNIKVK